MSISTYSELQTAVENWLHRADLDSRIPEFIALCEAKFNRACRLQTMETRVTATLDEEYEDLPTDYLEMRSIQITGTSGRPLEYMPPEMLRIKYRGAVSTPIHYTIIGDTLQFGPSPDGSYTMEMVYYKRIPALSDSQTTNWMLTNHPDVYLYGSLMEAEPFIMNDPRFPLWKSRYDQAIAEVMGEDQRKRFSGSPLMMRFTNAA